MQKGRRAIRKILYSCSRESHRAESHQRESHSQIGSFVLNWFVRNDLANTFRIIAIQIGTTPNKNDARRSSDASTEFDQVAQKSSAKLTRSVSQLDFLAKFLCKISHSLGSLRKRERFFNKISPVRFQVKECSIRLYHRQETFGRKRSGECILRTTFVICEFGLFEMPLIDTISGAYS